MIDIAEVARRSGLRASALRFYEEKGLIHAAARRGGRGMFDPVVLDQLALIALGRTAGFSLDEIAAMLGEAGAPRIDRQLLLDRADTIDRTIAELSAVRDGLRHAAACPASDHMQCPTFRHLLGGALPVRRDD